MFSISAILAIMAILAISLTPSPVHFSTLVANKRLSSITLG
jgi:hypothetical protein